MMGEDMESLELRIFREVAREKSISKAAEKLNYVQSNVTAHIKRLEEELGTTLFTRHGKGVTITVDGEKLLNYADSILELLDHAVTEFQIKKLKLRIGATPTLAASRLPGWIASYQKEFFDVSCSIVTDSQEKLIYLLENQVIDCAFVEQRYINSHIKSLFSFQEPLCIIAPHDSTTETLENYPLVVNNIESCPYRKLLLNWIFSKTHSTPAVVEFDTVEAICNAVSLGMGISLLPTNVVIDKRNIRMIQEREIGALDIHMVTLYNQQNKEVYQFQNLVKSQGIN